MKILIVKEFYDELGHYENFIYTDVLFDYICGIFKSKANGIHSFFSFKCDGLILNQITKHKYKIDRCLNDNNVKKFIQNNTIANLDIDINKYDIIWCRDDILYNIKELQLKYPTKLFIYENVEHCFSNFNYDYDLILDHTNFSFEELKKLNTKISFPYPINKDILRKNLSCIKSKTIYFDSRDIIEHAKNKNTSIDNINILISNYMSEVNISINMVNKRPEKTFNPLIDINNSTNTLSYLNKIGESKYFVLTFPRLGQSLVEAAALNCIVIGSKKSINSSFICYKECLFDNFASLQQIKDKVLYLESKPELQREILEYQDKMLTKYYYEHQKNVLEKALELKKNK